MKKALILVVDDNAEYREPLAWILDRYGFETISAKSGREALGLAIKCRPALVLMDLNQRHHYSPAGVPSRSPLWRVDCTGSVSCANHSGATPCALYWLPLITTPPAVISQFPRIDRFNRLHFETSGLEQP